MKPRKRITGRERARRDEAIDQYWRECVDRQPADKGVKAARARATELTARKFGVDERTVQRARCDAAQRREELERALEGVAAVGDDLRELMRWITKADIERRPGWDVHDFQPLAIERARVTELQTENKKLKRALATAMTRLKHYTETVGLVSPKGRRR